MALFVSRFFVIHFQGNMVLFYSSYKAIVADLKQNAIRPYLKFLRVSKYFLIHSKSLMALLDSATVADKSKIPYCQFMSR